MSRPQPDGVTRAKRARKLRTKVANRQFNQTVSDVLANGGPLGESNTDINNFFQAGLEGAGLSTSFTKGLPHDELGNASHLDFDTLREAINVDAKAATSSKFNVPLGPRDAPKANAGSQHSNAESKFAIKKIQLPDDNGVLQASDVKVRGWESPRAGHVYDTQGADAGAVGMAPAPALGSDELIAEIAEVYALALLRDFGFSKIQDNSTAKNKLGYSPKMVIDAVLSLPYFSSNPNLATAASRRLKGRLNSASSIGSAEIFRGSGPNAKQGPYVSQFMLIGNKGRAQVGQAATPKISDGLIAYGSQFIDQKVAYYQEGADFMTNWPHWLDVQNGANLIPLRYLAEANDKRFLCQLRDLAAYVHDDQLYQAYLNATLILLGAESGFDAGLPESKTSSTRTGFATFGGPHILALVTEVSTRALKAVRRQKFNVHMRARPERIAAMITRAANGEFKGWSGAEADTYEHMYNQLLGTGLLGWVSAANLRNNTLNAEGGQAWLAPTNPKWMSDDKNYLLPMAFPEGSPMHPAYGAGHATVAGACVTIIKAFFEMYDGKGNLKSLMAATGQAEVYQAGGKDGQKLTATSTEHELTLAGELDKLAANVSIGRNMAGVHFYSDYYDSVRMGERIAVQLLLDQMPTYGEDVSMRFPSFDGDNVTLSQSGSDTLMKVQDANGDKVSDQDWRLRHLQ